MKNRFMLGVTGTHSTGKSSFITKIKSSLSMANINASVICDIATEAQKKGFPILRDHTDESTLWLITYGISLELEYSLKNNVIIVDRPIVDAIGYYRAAIESTNRPLDTDYLNMLLTIASKWLSKYDVLYKTVLDTDITLGPGRDSDLAFRILADRKIEETISDLGVPHTCITLDSQAEHAGHAIDMIIRSNAR